MNRNRHQPGTPSLDYDEWSGLLCSIACRLYPKGIDSESIVGWARSQSTCSFLPADAACNAPRIERTKRDAHLDVREHYAVLLQLAGRSVVIQNDQVAELLPSDLVLIDPRRPLTFFHENGPTQQAALRLPRQQLIWHLGSEPQGGLSSRGTLAGRLLYQLVGEAIKDDSTSITSSAYMMLVIYDLLGALFAPHDPRSASRHTDKLFARICAIVKDRFADPNLGPFEVAAKAGISLRYLQKLFTARGTTCNQFIHALRLDHAARLLQRRAVLDRTQPLDEIARASGFHDYAYFSRKFRERFAHPPRAYAQCRNHKANV